MRMFNGREFVDVDYTPKPSDVIIVFDNSGPSYKSPKHLPDERPKEKVTEMRP